MTEAENGQAKAVRDGEYVSANMARENGQTWVKSLPGKGATFVIQRRF
jgi:hypothetical protein